MDPNSPARVLIYGTGAMGSRSGAWLSYSGCEVSVLARGRWLEHLHQNESPVPGMKARDETNALHQVFYGYFCEGEIT